MAVGDGANDVNMISQANVGFGIQGNEGNSACQAADYSCVKFKHVRRLIMYHGRQWGYRNTYFIHLVQQVQAMMAMVNFLYGLDNGFSGTNVRESIVDALYVMVCVVYSTEMWLLFSSDVEDIHDESWYPFSIPQLYKYKKDHQFKYSYHRIISWFVYIMFTCFVQYYLPFYALGGITQGGDEGGTTLPGQQGLAATLIMIFTNWGVVWVYSRKLDIAVFINGPM